MHWRPLATLDTLRLRAEVLAAIREYFRQQGVLELDTPTLGPGNVPDPEVSGLTIAGGGEDVGRHLQTSPELFMKRFVAAERVSCFQICKAFRLDERGKRHNPEFTLLEWYRIGFSTTDLIEDVVTLISRCASQVAATRQPTGSKRSTPTVVRITYRELFSHHVGLDPVAASTAQLAQLAMSHGAPEVDRLGALSYLLSQVIEPRFTSEEITVVTHFPKEQAALAHLISDDDGTVVADRFEVFVGDIELANGYGELTDPVEQRARFRADTLSRQSRGLTDAGSSEHLLAALEHGMPSCSGVAMGIDRLLMALLGADDLSGVMAFR